VSSPFSFTSPAIVGEIQDLIGAYQSIGAQLASAASNGDFTTVLDAIQSLGETPTGGIEETASENTLPFLATDQVLGNTAPPGAGVLPVSSSSPPLPAQVTGAEVVQEAEQFLGVPYRWGGTSPTTGFDCSGFVQYVYGQLGISLPRTSEEQATVGTPVPSLAEAQPGDLVFYAGSDGTPSSPGHVGIYIGNGEMIDAPETGETVSIQPVGNPVAIRRVLPSEPSLDATSSTGTGSTLADLVALGVPMNLIPVFEQAAQANGVPAALLAAVAAQESGFDPNAVSSAGAEGIMQLMPATAASLGVDPFNPAQAINGAAQLLSGYLQRYGGSIPLALAAYNAGPGAVEEYGGVPPFAQTQQYVADITQRLEDLS